MSAMETPFGPTGTVALTNRNDSVVDVDKMGGPKIAMEKRWRWGKKRWMDEYCDIIVLTIRCKEMYDWVWVFLLCSEGLNLVSVEPWALPLTKTLAW